MPASILVLLGDIAAEPHRAKEWTIAAFATMLVALVISLATRGGVGMGDVKLAFLLGAGLGAAVLGAIVVAMLATFVVSAGILARRGLKARKETIPFGPFLALGPHHRPLNSSSGPVVSSRRRPGEAVVKAVPRCFGAIADLELAVDVAEGETSRSGLIARAPSQLHDSRGPGGDTTQNLGRGPQAVAFSLSALVNCDAVHLHSRTSPKPPFSGTAARSPVSMLLTTVDVPPSRTRATCWGSLTAEKKPPSHGGTPRMCSRHVSPSTSGV